MLGGAAMTIILIMIPSVFQKTFADREPQLFIDPLSEFISLDPEQEETYLQMKDGVNDGPKSESFSNIPSNMSIAFRAFDQNVFLNPFLNDYLIRDNTNVVIHDGFGLRTVSKMSDLEINRKCHYMSLEEDHLAAITTCGHSYSSTIGGLIIKNETIMELGGVPTKTKRDVDQELVMVKRWRASPKPSNERELNNRKKMMMHHQKRWYPTVTVLTGPSDNNFSKRDKDKNPKTLELGVFMDDKAYKTYGPMYEYQDQKIVNFLLGLVNQMQAIFYQDSLKEKLILTVVHLEIFKTLPTELQFSSDEAYKVLSTFCDYQNKINPKSDDNPNHWDTALLFTGRKIYMENPGRKSSMSMGLSILNSVCDGQHSCIIGQLGSKSPVGKPFLTSGWLPAYVMAHEIGHTLGMLHDGYGNDCPRNGFLMSASRGTHGETQWSECSMEILKNLNASCLDDSPFLTDPQWNHMKFKMVPGQIWNANDQCKLFLKDQDAKLEIMNKSWCKRGECVPAKLQDVVQSGWEKWSVQPCTSGCLMYSKGIIRSTRKCKRPRFSGSSHLCVGQSFKLNLCDDSNICPRRKTASQYATSKCETYKPYVPRLTSDGMQMPYSKRMAWQACAIYCRLVSGSWYTPKYESNISRLEVFFPDGTWCHYDGFTNYYCVQNECIPEISNSK